MNGNGWGAITATVLAAISATACTQAVSAEPIEPSPSVSARPIPSSTNGPVDPPLPSDYDQETNNQLEPEEASLGQLWASADSEVEDAGSGSNLVLGEGLADFSAAIAIRCYPLLTEAESAELDQLTVGYESSTGVESFEAARVYFARATELCM